jgi:hypothetical protein
LGKIGSGGGIKSDVLNGWNSSLNMMK